MPRYMYKVETHFSGQPAVLEAAIKQSMALLTEDKIKGCVINVVAGFNGLELRDPTGDCEMPEVRLHEVDVATNTMTSAVVTIHFDVNWRDVLRVQPKGYENFIRNLVTTMAGGWPTDRAPTQDEGYVELD